MITRTRTALASLGVLLIAVGTAASLDSGQSPEPVVVAPAPSSREPSPDRAAVRRATELSAAFVAIAGEVTPAVVRIQAERSAAAERWLSRGLQDFFGTPRDTADAAIPQISGGSGFIVSENGIILTNNHVVDGADRIMVGLADRRTFEAHVVGRDPTTDVAVLRIEAGDLPALLLGDSDEARVGEWVLAVGNPGFDEASTLDFTVTSGIISAKGRPLNVIPQGLGSADEAGYAIEDFIQTDAVINPGNSGGPLIDLDGAVIGINTAIASTTGFNQGYGFAIPSNLAREVMRDLLEHGHVRRGLLGISISDVTADDAEVYGLDSISGVLIEDFAAASPARDAGLQRHDVIVAIQGAPVERVGQLQRLIAQREPGTAVGLSVVRFGERRTFTVQLAQAPLIETAAGDRTLNGRRENRAGVGIEVADLTPALARRFGFDRAGGVVVNTVVPYSAADRKRVADGHRIISIDRTSVSSAREARSLLRRARPGAVVSLLLQTPEGRTYIANVRVP
jgi:serine protease Do